MSGARHGDVLVVGAGPVGVTLALLLAEQGRSVVVVERWSAPYGLPRAVAISHESLRILTAIGFDRMDLLQSWADDEHEFVFRSADGEDLLRTTYQDGSISGYAPMYAFSQPQLEDELEAMMLAHPRITVVRGEQVSAIEEDGEQIRVHTEVVDELGNPISDGQVFEARFLAGADGANSTVRAHLGLEFASLAFSHNWLVVDVALDPERPDLPYGCQLIDPARPTTLISGGPGLRRWEFMTLPGEDLALVDTDERAWELLEPWGVTLENARLVRRALYTFHAEWLDSWHRGRIALCGDAAHLTPPFLGQGFNSGIRDAANLAWRIGLLLDAHADPRILNDYEAERGGQFRQILTETVNAGKLICVTDPHAARIRDDRLRARAADARPGRTEWPLGEAGTYDESAGAGQLAVGSPYDNSLPPGIGGRFLLVNASTTTPDRDELQWWKDLGGAVLDLSDPTTDLDGRYRAWLADLGVDAAIIRPDYYTFATATGADAPTHLITRLRDHLA